MAVVMVAFHPASAAPERAAAMDKAVREIGPAVARPYSLVWFVQTELPANDVALKLMQAACENGDHLVAVAVAKKKRNRGLVVSQGMDDDYAIDKLNFGA